MADLLAALHDGLVDWANAAARANWIDAEAVARLGDATVATPDALYDGAERPLVVGLFGGTGVGKSALLNRIAGREIARSSAERPTSTGISAYVHASVGIDRLPPDFPMERLHTALHHERRWADVLFIDMPDFDSVAAEHREIVERWLPYVDAVLYVTSPERYRDDRGWRLLVEHGREHAWLFVMNHWDRGDPRQLEDWVRTLADAGFADPEVFRTVCRPDAATGAEPGAASADDFGALVGRLETLADAQLVRDLQARGVVERVRRRLAEAEAVARSAGSPEAVAALPAGWRKRWAELSAGLSGALGTRAIEIAHGGAGRGGPGETGGAADVATDGERLIDEAMRARIEGAIARFVQERGEDLPRAVAARHLAPVRDGLGERAAGTVDAAVGRAVAAPGTPLRRAAHRVCTVGAFALPAAALGWVAWRAVAAFAAGGSDPGAYLGTDFAINAGLLVALAWALPWFAAKRLAPSLERARELGLRRGANEALENVGERVAAALEALAAERAALERRYREALAAVDGASEGARALPQTLRRLVTEAPAGRGDGPPSGNAGVSVPPIVPSPLDGPTSAGVTLAGSTSADPSADGVRATTQSSTDAAPVS